MTLCCITTSDTGVGLLPSSAAKLYYNHEAETDCCHLVPLCCITTTKRIAECCNLVPVYCITTTEAWASCDKAHTQLEVVT
jgi:hypothetical protein